MAAQNEWDVIIVGARVAGAGLAIRFARSGRSVLVVDRAALGSDTLSSHVLAGHGMKQMEALGVLDDIDAAGAPRLPVMRMDFDAGTITMPIQNGLGYTYSIRRTALDPILVRRAIAEGSAVRHEARMVEVVQENGRVAGILAEVDDGSLEQHRGRLIVGADGRHSTFADVVGAEVYEAVETPCGAMFAYFEGVAPATEQSDGLHFASGDRADTIMGPSDGGVLCALLIVGMEEYDLLRRQNAETIETRLRSIPGVAERFTAAQRVTKWRHAGPREVNGRFRKPFGPGWALVGDAGYKAHPAAGMGIGDALRGGELLHESVEKAWNEGVEADVYLPEYQERRDAEFRDAYYQSFKMASINPLNDGGIANFAGPPAASAAATGDA